MLAVVVTQLQVLLHAPNPNPTFGFFVIGKPLAVVLVAAAIATNLLGALRWWHWQRTLLRGKALAGGWEMVAVGGVAATIVVLTFVLLLAITVRKITE
jgi:uncharacterized membrane protein YidH (DUF202 family)